MSQTSSPDKQGALTSQEYENRTPTSHAYAVNIEYASLNKLRQAEQQTLSLVQYASLVTVSSAFHSLFKVLLNFPSRYLFAIGLPQVFSL